jgi:hypothetical protein
MYELATGRIAFHQDWAVLEYGYGYSDLSIDMPGVHGFLLNHLSKNVEHLLSKQWRERPSALEVRLIFSSYLQLLSHPLASLVIDSIQYPPYVEWREMVGYDSNEFEFLSALANTFGRRNEHIATTIRREYLGGVQAPIDGQSASRISSLERYIENGDYDIAIPVAQICIEKALLDYKLWHNMFMAYLGRCEFSGALIQGRKALHQGPNTAVVVAICNVNAAREIYKQAIDDFIAYAGYAIHVC